MRSGSSAGSVLKRRLISLRCGAAGQPGDHRDPLLGPVGAGDRRLEQLLEVALGVLRLSVKMSTRVSVQPARRRGSARGSTSTSRRAFASGSWRWASAISCIRSSNARSRSVVALAASVAAVTAVDRVRFLALEVLAWPFRRARRQDRER